MRVFVKAPLTVAMLVIVVLLAPTLRSQEPTLAPPVRVFLSVVDVVHDHHIEAPARRSLVMAAARALHADAGMTVPGNLSFLVTAEPAREELTRFLQDVWMKTVTERSSRRRKPGEAMLATLHRIPGGGQLVRARDHEVHGQVSSNRYVGTGIALRMDPDLGRAVMMTVFEDGPADRAGARDGDVIEEIDTVSTRNMALREIVDRLRGPKGSPVEVVLRQPERGSRSRTYRIIRDVVPFATVSDYRTYSSAGDHPIAYLRIDSISGSSVPELREFEKRMQGEGIRGLVLDLRGTTGGTLHHTVLLADALLDGGPIGQVRFRESVQEYDANRDALFKSLRVAVLVDGKTAGASEWLIAALRDRDRAILVGEPTYGDSFVRRGVPVPGMEFVFLVATGYLERANGERVGRLEPDHRMAPPVAPALDNDAGAIVQAVRSLQAELGR